MIEAAEERPWLWVVYILTVALPVFLVILFCCSGKVCLFVWWKNSDDVKITRMYHLRFSL